MPLFGQDLAALTMGESEMLFFAAMQRHMSFAGGLDAPWIILATRDDVDQDAQVVQQAGEVGLLGVGIADQFCHLAAHQRTAQGVTPESHRVHSPHLSGGTIRFRQQPSRWPRFASAPGRRPRCAPFPCSVVRTGRVCHPRTSAAIVPSVDTRSISF